MYGLMDPVHVLVVSIFVWPASGLVVNMFSCPISGLVVSVFCGQCLSLWSVCVPVSSVCLVSYVYGSVCVCVNPAMNQVHFASLEDEDEDMYSGFNDFSANDMTQVRLT